MAWSSRPGKMRAYGSVFCKRNSGFKGVLGCKAGSQVHIGKTEEQRPSLFKGCNDNVCSRHQHQSCASRT